MEERLDLPRLLVAAPASGSGKTTVTCALLRAFQRRGLDPCAFKCGPDYIDPMFHREVLGLPSRNLDLFFSGEDQARALLSSAGRGRTMAARVRAAPWGRTTSRMGVPVARARCQLLARSVPPTPS